MKTQAVALGLVVFLCGLLGATPPWVEAGEVKTIEFLGTWPGPAGETMKKIVAEFNRTHDAIKVNTTMLPTAQAFDTFIIQASAKKGPDVINIQPHVLPGFVELGTLRPLNSFIEHRTALRYQDFSKRVLEMASYKNWLYGLPLDVHMHGLIYNTAALEKAGIKTPLGDLTGKEFLEIARRLTVDKGGKHPGDAGFDPKNIVQYAINMYTNHHAYLMWYGFYSQFEGGGKIISDDQKSCAMDLDRAARAWKWMQDLVYAHTVAPQGQQDFTRDFLDGRTAMLFDGPWRFNDLQRAASQKGLKWNAAKLPKVFDRPGTWGNMDILALPRYANPSNVDAAYTFIEWLVSKQSGAWAESGMVPTYQGVKADEVKRVYGIAPYAEMAAHTMFLPAILKYNEIFAFNAPTPMVTMGQNIIINRADVRPEVEAACKAISRLLVAP